MASEMLLRNDKLIFIDTGHPHGRFSADEIHVHEVDLSKITIGQLEELQRESRNGYIEYHTWKKISEAVIDREPTADEIKLLIHKLEGHW